MAKCVEFSIPRASVGKREPELRRRWDVKQAGSDFVVVLGTKPEVTALILFLYKSHILGYKTREV